MRARVPPLLALLAFPALITLVLARTDDFEFDDDAPNDSSKGGNRRYVYNPSSELCATLSCPRGELCVLRGGAALCAPREVAMSFHKVEVSDDVFYEPSDEPSPREGLGEAVGRAALPPSGAESPAPAVALASAAAAAPDDDALDADDVPELDSNDLGDGTAKLNPKTPAEQCMGCSESGASFVCGSDNRTYSSLCRLDLHNCLRRAATAAATTATAAGDVRLACRGFCPCRRPRNNRRRNDEGRGQAGVGAGSGAGARCDAGRLAERLLDWFSVLQGQAKQPPPPAQGFPRGCLSEVRWMFGHLDADGDRLLSDRELYALRHDEGERCLRPFLSRCAARGRAGAAGGLRGAGGVGGARGAGGVSRAAWCACLRRAARPCAAAKRDMRRTQPEGWSPSCDGAGYFLPRQCAARGCWCVDRRGAAAACPPPAPAAPALSPAAPHAPEPAQPSDDEDAPGSGDGDY